MSITAANVVKALKEFYAGQKMSDLTVDPSAMPLWSRIKKVKMGGKSYPIPIVYEEVAGGSNTFTTAQSNAGAPKLAEFFIQYSHMKPYYRVVQLETLASMLMGNDIRGFMSEQRVKMESGMRALASDVETSLFGSSIAALAEISSISTTAVTLKDARDARKFEIGMECVASNTAQDEDAKTAFGVSAINLETGVITFDADVSGSWEDDDYIYREGDYVTSAAGGQHFYGLQDWFPSSDTSAFITSAFLGETRSTHRSKLAGVNFSSGSLADIQDTIWAAALQTKDYFGDHGDVCFLPSAVYRLLAKELKIEVRREADDGRVGLKRIYMDGPNGSAIELVQAPKCKTNTAYLLKMDTMFLLYAGPDAIFLYQEDGQMASRIYNADAQEIRFNGYLQLGCNKPGLNTVITLS